MTGATASRFGRYEVLGTLPSAREGAEVLVAVDQQSGRKVALRVVDIRRLPAEALALYTRDLKVLARVRHGSLPTIHDVGADAHELYVAEEAVVGQTLEVWLGVKKRSWRDIARVFVSVAGAITAVHGAGLVCREIRASGIIITKDRRVVVTDLGLQVPRAGGPAHAGSPEEAAERPGDARTDQLALCVLLHRALFGTPAYRPSDDGRPTFEVTDTTNASPVIPAALRALLDRGLARDPAARFPAMALLGSTLHGIVERRRHAPRLIAAAVAVGVLALSAGTVAGAWVRIGTPFSSLVERLNQQCDRVEPSFVGVWDRERDAELRRTLWRGSGGPEVAPAWLTVRRQLDAWTAQWRARRTSDCQPRRGASGDSLAAAQQTITCLAQTRERLVALLDAVPELGPRHTVLAVAALGDPTVCPSQPVDAWLEGLRKGTLEPGSSRGVELGLRAAHEWSEGGIAAAITHLETAIALRTEDAADDELARLLANLGTLRAEAGQPEQALAALRRALKIRERLGQQESIETAWLWHDLGTVLDQRGVIQEALAAHQKALDIELAKLGPDSLESATSLRAVAKLERDAKRFEESLTDYRRALAVRREALGEDSGEVAVSNIELGWALIAAGKAGEAAERFVIAEHVGQRVMGRASRLVARALEGRGVADVARGQAAKAIPVLEEALATLERTGGDTGQIARTRLHLATALVGAGVDRDRARRLGQTVHDRLIDDGLADSPQARALDRWLASVDLTPTSDGSPPR